MAREITNGGGDQGRNPIEIHLDPFDLMGNRDEEELAPYASPYRPRALNRADTDTLRSYYEKLSEGAGLADTLNMGSGNKLRKITDRIKAVLGRRGNDFSDIDIQDFSGDFGLTDTNLAMQGLLDAGERGRYNAGFGNTAGLTNEARIKLEEKINRLLADKGATQIREDADQHVFPLMDQAEGLLTQAASESAVSAGQEQVYRSRLAEQNRVAAGTNITRLTNALGLRGMADSPAAAALASSVAEDYDRGLMGALSDQALQVRGMNQQANLANTSALQQLAGTRLNVQRAVTSGDTGALIDANRSTQALLDALYSRGQTLAMQKDSIDASKPSGNEWIGPAISVLGGVLAPFTGGASLALTGAAGAFNGKGE